MGYMFILNLHYFWGYSLSGDHSFLRVNNDKFKNGFIGHFNKFMLFPLLSVNL